MAEFPTLEAIASVPPIIDPFEQDLIPVRCQIQAVKGGKVVKGVTGRAKSWLTIIDNITGETQAILIDKTRFNTGLNGVAPI